MGSRADFSIVKGEIYSTINQCVVREYNNGVLGKSTKIPANTTFTVVGFNLYTDSVLLGINKKTVSMDYIEFTNNVGCIKKDISTPINAIHVVQVDKPVATIGTNKQCIVIIVLNIVLAIILSVHVIFCH